MNLPQEVISVQFVAIWILVNAIPEQDPVRPQGPISLFEWNSSNMGMGMFWDARSEGKAPDGH